MSQEILLRHQAVWSRKPVLRLLYEDWYRQIRECLAPGSTLELGSGSSHFRDTVADTVRTDVVPFPGLDAVVDAQSLPFSRGAFNNIVLFDVLHHVENPVVFFEEAARVLINGGRVVLMEPFISWMSWPIYHFLHPEEVDLKCDPLALNEPSPNRSPFDGNQAIPTLMFRSNREAFEKRFPEFRICRQEYMSFLVYPLSGGYDHPSLIPGFAAKWFLRFERVLKPLGPWMAFRMLVVLEMAAADKCPGNEG